MFVFDCSINSDVYGLFSHRHLPHIFLNSIREEQGLTMEAVSTTQKHFGFGQTHLIEQS